MTFTLSGFADEISPEPAAQLETLAAESIRHLELRSAWSTNVASLTDAELASFRREIEDAGVRVSAIGSPIGKIGIGEPLGPELERMRRIADVATGRRSSTGWARSPRSRRSAGSCWRTRTRRRSTVTSRGGART
jgi:hypothetical protein